MKILIYVLFITFQTIAFAAKPYVIDGQPYVEGPYEKACNAFEAKDFAAAAEKFRFFLKKFPKHTCAEEARFLLGVCYFNMCEYDFANQSFSKYLECSLTPKHFEDVVKYKFCIAKKFQQGEGRRVLGFKRLPKWMSAEQEAIDIYEELATIYPHDDIAAYALFNKACILLKRGCFKDSVEEYQTVIRRFPRTPIAAMSFQGISVAYVEEAKLQPCNPDFLCLAMVNLKKFKLAFPGDEKLDCLEKNFLIMQATYAKGFYDMGLFYERTDHKRAAWIYYMTTIKEFPNTQYACLAKSRLKILCLPEA
jgi:TolA-binding protein